MLVVGLLVVPHLKPLEVTVAELSLVTLPLKYAVVEVLPEELLVVTDGAEALVHTSFLAQGFP